jgi:hypothetical protein
LDVLITTDTTPRFDLGKKDSGGKSFSPVEGTLGVASIKSYLDKERLSEALEGIATIPPTKNLDGRITQFLSIRDYDDWPYKIIYSKDALSGATIAGHVNDFYASHAEIPVTRRPNIIHVAGKYVIIRLQDGMKVGEEKAGAPGSKLEIGTFILITKEPDLHGIVWTLTGLQENAMASAHILYNYRAMLNKVLS